MTIRSYHSQQPRIDSSAFVDGTALVIGDVRIGADSSIWPMTTVRGDVQPIRIGARSNIQDGSVLHATRGCEIFPNDFPLRIGDDVTVGHRVVLHACTIEDLCLIGMGSVVLDGATIASGAIVGANSLVPPGKHLAGGFLWLGSPVSQARTLNDKEKRFLKLSAEHYIELKNRHKAKT